MEKLTGPLADALARRREAFNARYLAAKSAAPALDDAAFLRHVREVLDPLVRQVAATFAEKVDSVTMALYDISVDLFVANLLGPEAKSPWIAAVWRTMLPQLTTLLARDPTRLTVALCNAAANLGAVRGARPQEWLDRLAVIGPRCSSTAVLCDCGKVIAWQAGLPHYRATALDAAMGLPLPLAAAALGVPDLEDAGQLAAVVERLKQDPWLDPQHALQPPAGRQQLQLVARVGEFRGFGGPFLRPPTVSATDEELFVADGEGVWRLFADRYGATFFRAERPDTTPQASRNMAVDRQGAVRWGSLKRRFPELSESTSVAADGTTLAITLRTSHRVFLLAPALDAASCDGAGLA